MWNDARSLQRGVETDLIAVDLDEEKNLLETQVTEYQSGGSLDR